MKSVAIVCCFALALLGVAAAGAAEPEVNQILGQYYTIQKSLAADSTNGIAASARQIANLSRQAAAADQSGKNELLAVSASAAKFNSADIKAARNSFGDLSEKLIAYLKASKGPKNPPYQYYCPMVKKNWLQPEKGIHNPYYGSSMQTCGELVP